MPRQLASKCCCKVVNEEALVPDKSAQVRSTAAATLTCPGLIPGEVLMGLLGLPAPPGPVEMTM
jgi:hypothetical protein